MACDVSLIVEVMLMKLYLVQHGEAKPESEDPERSLTIKATSNNLNFEE